MKCRTALVVLAAVGVALCAAESPIAPRDPALIDDIEATAQAFRGLSSTLAEALDSGDEEAIQALLYEHVVQQDGTPGVVWIGSDVVAKNLASYGRPSFPHIERQVTNCFIGLDEGLAVLKYTGFKLEHYLMTEEDPGVILWHLKTKDGLISDWSLYYELDTLEKAYRGILFLPSELREEARSLLSSYASAWSSGNPDVVADLYAVDAARKDMVFGDHQVSTDYATGRELIAWFAESFFSWYPGAQWELLLAFGDGLGGLREWGKLPVTGGIFKIESTDRAGQPCDVRVAVLLRTCGGKIVQESLYYDAETLIRCGWAG